LNFRRGSQTLGTTCRQGNGMGERGRTSPDGPKDRGALTKIAATSKDFEKVSAGSLVGPRDGLLYSSMIQRGASHGKRLKENLKTTGALSVSARRASVNDPADQTEAGLSQKSCRDRTARPTEKGRI